MAQKVYVDIVDQTVADVSGAVFTALGKMTSGAITISQIGLNKVCVVGHTD